MLWFKRREPEAPKKIKVGKGVVEVHTNDGEIYRQEISGGAYDMPGIYGNYTYRRTVHQIFISQYVEGTGNFLLVHQGEEKAFIPFQRILKMKLVEVDESYEVDII